MKQIVHRTSQLQRKEQMMNVPSFQNLPKELLVYQYPEWKHEK